MEDINFFLKSYLIPKDYDNLALDSGTYNMLFHYKTMLNELFNIEVIPNKDKNENILMKKLIKYYCPSVRFRESFNMTDDGMFVCRFP